GIIAPVKLYSSTPSQCVTQPKRVIQFPEQGDTLIQQSACLIDMLVIITGEGESRQRPGCIPGVVQGARQVQSLFTPYPCLYHSLYKTNQFAGPMKRFCPY